MNVTGSSELTLDDVETAASIVQENANPEANIIFGATASDGFEDEMRVTVIATGFEPKSEFEAPKAPAAAAAAEPAKSGDIGDIEYAKQLRGYKVLVCGNHDVGHTKYAEVFDEIYAGPVFIADRLVLSHEPIMLDFAFNIHGHNHSSVIQDGKHLNVCSDMIGYTPINFNQFVKSGALAKVPSIHRVTIDGATERKQKRLKKGKKKI